MSGWQDGEVARRYLRTIDVLIPRRGEILSVFADLADTFTAERPVMLDLGAGAGEVTAAILARRQHAYATLVDYSDEMLAMSAARFADNPGITVLKQDLNLGLPGDISEQGFDLVVSCFSLHHIEYANRVQLYADVWRALRPGGLFINAERLNVNRSFADVKASQMESDKRQGDKPGTIWEMERDLRLAGFGAVDCLWKYQTLAVLAATK